jgi:hypothetical protein
MLLNRTLAQQPGEFHACKANIVLTWQHHSTEPYYGRYYNDNAWNVDDYVSACSSGAGAIVCDPDHVLSEKGRDDVASLISAISHGDAPYAKLFFPPCNGTGIQIALAVMNSMDASMSTPNDFVATLYQRWRMGKWGDKPVCDNGVLYYLSLSPRKDLIFVGDSLKDGLLSHSTTHAILANVEGDLANRRFDAACLKIVQYLGDSINGKPPVDYSMYRMFFIAGLLVVTAIGAFGTLLLKELCHKEYKSARSRLQELQRLQSQLQTGDQFNASSCPICLEDYSTNRVANQINLEDSAEDEPLLAQDQGTSTPLGGSPRTTSIPIVAFEVEGGPSRSQNYDRGSSPKPSRAISGTISQEEQVARKPLTLPCRHTFCEPCISSWMKGKEGQEIVPVCPVCRQPIGDIDGLHEPPQDDTVTPEELLARISALRSKYPNYIDDELASAVQDDIISGRPVRASVFQDLADREPGLSRAMRALSKAGSRGWSWASFWRRRS